MEALHYKRHLHCKLKGIPEDDASPPPLFVRTKPFLGRNSAFLREDGTVRIPQLERSFVGSSLGILDSLPVEILSMILMRLDVRSLCRFMSVSSSAKEAAQSLLGYRHLVQYAGSVLVMLGKTRLAKMHSIESLHGVLTSPACVSCGEAGAFICLPTCERACLNCLNRNMRFWVLTPAEARKAYVLRVRDVDSLPTLWTVNQPGRGRPIRRQKAVSERHAAELALRRHGEDGDSGENQRCWVSVAREDKLVDWTTDGSTIIPYFPYGLRPVKCAKWGLQFMEMPYISRGTHVEPTLWCEGCAATYALDPVVIRTHVEYGYEHGYAYNSWNVDLTMERAKEIEMKEKACLREWPMPSLLTHLDVCDGVRWLKQRANWEIPSYWQY